MRDDFDAKTKNLLGARVAFKCSNPSCRQPTAGPQQESTKAVNLGVAAHISAASPGGPRYDPTLSPAVRTGIANGIWLCQKCAKLVDNDPQRYSESVLERWRCHSESIAEVELRSGPADTASHPLSRAIAKAEGLMPTLLQEMRDDLAAYPLRREFVLLPDRRAIYLGGGTEFVYYSDEHEDLDSKALLLENLGLVHDVTRKDIKRYRMTEDFVEALTPTSE